MNDGDNDDPKTLSAVIISQHRLGELAKRIAIEGPTEQLLDEIREETGRYNVASAAHDRYKREASAWIKERYGDSPYH